MLWICRWLTHVPIILCYSFLIEYFSFLFSATRMIRRKVPAAGHLMTPRRLWLNKIPTQCDVVIEFPGKPSN